jgi:hypothetical protein
MCQLFYKYSISPDDGLQICPKHVEVDWWNKLRINSASSWFSLHGCVEMHSQQNIEFNSVCFVTRIFQGCWVHMKLSTCSLVVVVWEKLRIFVLPYTTCVQHNVPVSMMNVPSSSESINSWTPEVEGITAVWKEWLSPVQQYLSGMVTCTCTYTHT